MISVSKWRAYLTSTQLFQHFFFGVFQPEVFITHKHNVSVSSTTLHFMYNKNSTFSGRHVSIIIRPSSGHLGKQIQELSIFQCVERSQMLTGHLVYRGLFYIQHNVVRMLIVN
jgi:hypothetical protein